MHLSLVVSLFLLIALVFGKENLPPTDSLRIGIKHRPENCERKAKNGDSIRVHYTGTLYRDGSQFDSSVGRGPFDLKLGTGSVIKGWDEGLFGMCVGEKRRLVIPSGKGYGDRGSPPKIEGGDTLVFDVEMLSITD